MSFMWWKFTFPEVLATLIKLVYFFVLESFSGGKGVAYRIEKLSVPPVIGSDPSFEFARSCWSI